MIHVQGLIKSSHLCLNSKPSGDPKHVYYNENMHWVTFVPYWGPIRSYEVLLETAMICLWIVCAFGPVMMRVIKQCVNYMCRDNFQAMCVSVLCVHDCTDVLWWAVCKYFACVRNAWNDCMIWFKHRLAYSVCLLFGEGGVKWIAWFGWLMMLPSKILTISDKKNKTSMRSIYCFIVATV